MSDPGYGRMDIDSPIRYNKTAANNPVDENDDTNMAGGANAPDLSPYNSDSMVIYNSDNNPASSPVSPNTKAPSSPGGSMSTDRDISTIAEDRLQDVKTYFTNTGLKFRRPIATGNHGGTVLFDKFAADGTTLEQSLVVKYALDTEEDASTNNDDDLSNEMFWLEKFVHAEHIIQVTPEYRRLWRNNEEGGGAGHILKRPVIVMEYMGHGTLHQAKRRFRFMNLKIPDRLVWHFALCLVRACVAMGYPEQFENAEATVRERVPPRPAVGGPTPLPGTITQNSLKGLNVLVGELIPEDREHRQVPLLKLIDFGRGLEQDPQKENKWGELIGLAYNLYGIGRILQDLLYQFNEEDEYLADWTIEDNEVFDRFRLRTGAERGFLNDEGIDRLLRDTIALFMGDSPKSLPDLFEAVLLCRLGIRQMRTSAVRANSDEALRECVQRVMFDADFDPFEFESEILGVVPEATYSTPEGGD